MGPSRVMLGSDYPFPLGEQRIGELVRTCDGLSARTRDAIMGGNATRFFDLQTAEESARASPFSRT